jgi:hypothetical protein
VSYYAISTEVNLPLYERARIAAKKYLGDECRTEAWTASGGWLGDLEVFAVPNSEAAPPGTTRIPGTEFAYRICTDHTSWPRPVLYARKAA